MYYTEYNTVHHAVYHTVYNTVYYTVHTVYYTVYTMYTVQGGFFDCSSPISVPKRKSPISQSQPFLLTKFNETAAVIG